MHRYAQITIAVEHGRSAPKIHTYYFDKYLVNIG